MDLVLLPLAGLKHFGTIDAVQRMFYAPHLAVQPRKVNSSVKTRCADSYAIIFTPYCGEPASALSSHFLSSALLLPVQRLTAEAR